MKVGKEVDKIEGNMENDFFIEGTFQYNKKSDKIQNIEINDLKVSGRKNITSEIRRLLEALKSNDVSDKNVFEIRGKYKLRCGIVSIETFAINSKDITTKKNIINFIARNTSECKSDIKGGKRKTRRYKRKRARFSKKAR